MLKHAIVIFLKAYELWFAHIRSRKAETCVCVCVWGGVAFQPAGSYHRFGGVCGVVVVS